jgi:hypothetical protein
MSTAGPQPPQGGALKQKKGKPVGFFFGIFFGSFFFFF